MGPHVGRDEAADPSAWLMCSDGLTNMLDDNRIEHYVKEAGSVDEAVNELIAAANNAGGKDNVTALLIDPEIGSHFGSVVAGTGWQQIIERTVHVHSGGKGIAHTVCSGHIGAEGIRIAAAFFPLCVS